MKSGFRGARTALLMLAGSVWLGGCSFVGGAQTSDSAPSTLPPTQALFLDYRELDAPVANFGVSYTPQPTPFKKEPNLGGRKVTRGILKFGNSTDQFIPFIFDGAQGKLYLDLNRNQDLTDDANEVFSCPVANYVGAQYQPFLKIPLTFKTDAGSQRALVDLGIYTYASPIIIQAGSRYCWDAKATFQDHDYQLVLVDNLAGRLGSPEGGFLALRPWSARNQYLSVQDNSLTGFPFTRDLFFAGQTYRLDWTFFQQAGTPRYKLELNPQPSELGALRLTGKYVNRLVLTRDSNPSLTVVLDAPGVLEKAPRGVYHFGLTLKQGGVEAHRQVYGVATNPQIIVGGADPVVLAAGGPLTNTVTVDRSGKNLRLSYQLVGAGGQSYELQGQRKEPEFAVFRAGKKIDSGRFQFG